MRNKVCIPKILIYSLIIVYILSQNILYLVPVNNNYNNCAYVILTMVVWYTIFVREKGQIEKSKFTVLMLLPCALAFLASIVECSLYSDASLTLSIYRQMQWWIYGLAYFVFQSILKKSDESYKIIINSFIFIAIVQLVIGIVQYANPDTLFTFAPMTKRLGAVRYYFPIVLMVFGYFWAFNRFLNNESKASSIMIMVAVLFEAMFVQQFRSTLIGIVLSTVVGFMLWKKIAIKKVIVCLLAGFVAYVLCISTPFLQQSLGYMFNGDTSLNVRSYLIEFMLENAKSKWLFGCGWVSSPMAYDYAATPYREHINLSVFAFADGGIFSILYSYGIFGVIWVVVLWHSIIKKAWALYQKQNNYLYLLFPLYQIITMYIDIHWYIHDQFFVMAMFCALLDYDSKKYLVEENRKI